MRVVESITNPIAQALKTVPPHWQRRGCVLLSLLLILSLIRLVLLLVVSPELPELAFPAATSSKQPEVMLYPKTEVASGAEQNLAEASFDGALLGVVRSENKSFASIQLSGGDVIVFRQGDELASGVILESIEPLRVVVREHGVLRQLSLASLLDKAESIDHGEIRQQPPLSENAPGQLAVTPVLGDDVSGLRVEQLSPELAALNLVQPGDLVVAVDGVEMSALLADSSALEVLAEQDSLSLSVVRDGRQLEMDVDGALVKSMVNGN